MRKKGKLSALSPVATGPCYAPAAKPWFDIGLCFVLFVYVGVRLVSLRTQ